MAEKNRKLPAEEWLPVFETAGVRAEDLVACKSKRSKSIKIGQFLSPKVGREVVIEVRGKAGKAVLRVEKDRAKTKRYFFEVTWDDLPTEKEPTGKTEKKKAKKKAEIVQAHAGKSRKQAEPVAKKAVKAAAGKSGHAVASSKATPAGQKCKAPPRKSGGTALGNEEDWG